MATRTARTVSPVASEPAPGVESAPAIRSSGTPGKLTALAVNARKAPGYLSDGGNLWLRVTAAGAKSWAFIYTVNHRTREHGLGSFHDISLAEARELAREARGGLTRGIDPIEQRRASVDRIRTEDSNRITFSAAAAKYIAAKKSGWKSQKHAAQWAATLETYAAPVFGSLPVASVTMGHVLRVLEPIWTEKPETASRVRGRIESVLDWAKGRGYCSGPNPAVWKGGLDAQLASHALVKVKHHEAMKIDALPGFMVELRKRDGISARALEFAVLTATRTNEVLNATWGEVDLKEGAWTIPAERMKASKEHRVPLSRRALEILKELEHREGFIFLNARRGRPLSSAAMSEMLKTMVPGLTVHGFRSTFRDWCSERTNTSREVVEMSLAHAIGNAVEAAYRRGELFTKRAKLMGLWESFTQKEYLNSSGTRFALLVPIGTRKEAAA
jgi:integrase